jgi:hypothetical protein
MLETVEALTDAALEAVETTPITDVHTHLFPPSHGDLLLWGVDEVLTYHYLVAELFTVAPRELSYEKFWSLSKREQADLVWEHVFLRHGALSEAARGAITTFNRLGLDVAGRDLAGIREWFAAQKVEEYLPKVFELAGLDSAVMTNNPFNAEEAGFLRQDLPCPGLLKTALRIDPLLVSWESAVEAMAGEGYQVRAEPDEKTFDEVRRYLVDWSERIGPVYFAASLGPDFAYPDDSPRTRVIERAILPAAMEVGVPFAMMIGVRKQVNPGLGDGGDSVGVADPMAVANLCARWPEAKFLVTMLSRVNQHELCVVGRKFGNLHLFGCWWFCNNPSIIDEMTRQRLELLGTAFTCQHSDARVLDQLIYKWTHTRRLVGEVLVDKYADQFEAGWRPTAEEVRRDVRAIFGGSFAEFMAK